MATETIVSCQESRIMETKVMTSVTALLTICGMLWLISCRSVSTSFV